MGCVGFEEDHMKTFRVVYRPTGELVLDAAERIRREQEAELRLERVLERFRRVRRENHELIAQEWVQR